MWITIFPFYIKFKCIRQEIFLHCSFLRTIYKVLGIFVKVKVTLSSLLELTWYVIYVQQSFVLFLKSVHTSPVKAWYQVYIICIVIVKRLIAEYSHCLQTLALTRCPARLLSPRAFEFPNPLEQQASALLSVLLQQWALVTHSLGSLFISG